VTEQGALSFGGLLRKLRAEVEARTGERQGQHPRVLLQRAPNRPPAG
jgi:hypothetical protein